MWLLVRAIAKDMSHFHQRTLPGIFIRMVVLGGMITNYNLKSDPFPDYSLEKLCVYWEAIIVLWQNIACAQNLPPLELAPYVFVPRPQIQLTNCIQKQVVFPEYCKLL